MDCWDLEAVVKGCGYSSSSPAANLDPFTSMPQHDPTPTLMPDFSLTEDLRRPFIYQPQERWTSLPQPHSHLRSNPSTSCDTVLPMSHQRSRPQPAHLTRPKRSRKSQLKKVVCEIPVDSAAPDLWAWRKYGQKPIKGSPYPRGYYRCSSSKGCPARKQVERSRADPGVLVITYTAEHNHPVPTHRSSLAGSTRNKFTAPPASSQTVQETAGLSPTTPLKGSSMEELLRQLTPEEEEEEELLMRDLELMGDEILDVGVFPEAWSGAAAVGAGEGGGGGKACLNGWH